VTKQQQVAQMVQLPNIMASAAFSKTCFQLFCSMQSLVAQTAQKWRAAWHQPLCLLYHHLTAVDSATAQTCDPWLLQHTLLMHGRRRAGARGIPHRPPPSPGCFSVNTPAQLINSFILMQPHLHLPLQQP
jgi:hypothetical protein